MQLGYRANVQLMLHLVDCLTDACDIYLANYAKTIPAPMQCVVDDDADEQEVELENSNLSWLIDANSGLQLIEEHPVDDWRNEQKFKEEHDEDDAEYHITRPMNWPDSVEPSTSTECTSSQRSFLDFFARDQRDPSKMDTITSQPETIIIAGNQVNQQQRQHYGCWPKAIEWIRTQLLDVRMRLLMGSRTSLTDSLAKFGQLDDYLHNICLQVDTLETLYQEQQAASLPARYLAYIKAAVQIMGQLNNGGRQQTKGSMAAELAERAAHEIVQYHYSYLAQIITSFSAIFNSIGGELDALEPLMMHPLVMKSTGDLVAAK